MEVKEPKDIYKPTPKEDRAYLRSLSRKSAVAVFFTLLGIAVGYALLT